MMYNPLPEKLLGDYLCLVQQVTQFPLFECPSEYSWLIDSVENPEIFQSKLFNEFLEFQYLPELTQFGEDMLRDEIFSDVSPKPVGLPLHLVAGTGFDFTNKKTAAIFPPHNISEVIDAIFAKLENPRIRSRSVCEIIKAPDFAAGGTIITSTRKLSKCYSTGQGSMVHKCDTRVDKDNSIHFLVLEPAFAAIQLGSALLSNRVGGISKYFSSDGSIVVIPELGANLDEVKSKVHQLPGFTTAINFDMTILENCEEIKRFPINKILQAFITHRLDFLWRAHKCSKTKVSDIMLNELLELKRKYGLPRRTRIEIVAE